MTYDIVQHDGGTCRKRGPSPLPAFPRSRRGLTLVETLLVMVVIGTMSAVAIPPLSGALTRQDVQSARVAFVGMYAQARHAAIQRASKTRLILANNVVSIESANPVTDVSEPVGNPVDLNSRYGVTVQPPSGTWTFDSRGLGTAAGQSSVSIAKGTDSTEIVISAVGRVIP